MEHWTKATMRPTGHFFTFLAVYWVILAGSRLLSELRIEEVAGFMLLPCLVLGGESTAYRSGATMDGRR